MALECQQAPSRRGRVAGCVGVSDLLSERQVVAAAGAVLEVQLGAGAIDLANASEIPPIFAAQSGGSGTLATVAVRQGSTLLQEVDVPAGSAIKTVADLKGKKVAYVQNTTAHLFLFESLYGRDAFSAR